MAYLPVSSPTLSPATSLCFPWKGKPTVGGGVALVGGITCGPDREANWWLVWQLHKQCLVSHPPASESQQEGEKLIVSYWKERHTGHHFCNCHTRQIRLPVRAPMCAGVPYRKTGAPLSVALWESVIPVEIAPKDLPQFHLEKCFNWHNVIGTESVSNKYSFFQSCYILSTLTLPSRERGRVVQCFHCTTTYRSKSSRTYCLSHL